MLTATQAAVRVAALRQQLRSFARLVALNKPLPVSDSIWDQLKQELVQLEQAYPSLITPDSPTQVVSSQLSKGFAKVQHQVRQWSLADSFTELEFLAWVDQVTKKVAGDKLEFLCELKIDGVHLVLTYQQGKLVLGATRGDGQLGEDVTANVKQIKSIPQHLKEAVDLIVEGEIWMSKDSFKQLNIASDHQFANPRNAAVGSLRQKDPQVTASRKLDVWFYDLAWSAEELPLTQAQELSFLKKLGLPVNPHNKLFSTPSEVWKYISYWTSKIKEEPYWADGVVVKVNSISQQQELGYRGKSPRFALACKFPAVEVKTVVEKIVVQVGRTGILTPVVELTPVNLEGSVVKRATLHNLSRIQQLDLRVSDTVILRKAGGIIPEIVKVLPELRVGSPAKFKMPKICPGCSTSSVEQRQVDGLILTYCLNQHCPAQNLRRWQHFVGAESFNIPGLGPKLLKKLLEEKMIVNFSDLFELTVLDLIKLPLVGKVKAENLCLAINKSKKISLANFIFSLGIRGVGQETARLLAHHFKTLTKLKAATKEQFLNLAAVGPVLSQVLVDYWQGPGQSAAHLELESKLVFKPETVAQGQVLAGLKVAVTGKFDLWSRKELKLLLVEAGARVVSQVSQQTDYLIVGQQAGSKLKQAESLGVPLIKVDQIANFLKQGA